MRVSGRWVLTILLGLTWSLAGCQAAPSVKEKQIIEYRQVMTCDPVEAARIMRALLPVQVEADASTGTLIIKGSQEQVAGAMAMITRLEESSLGPDLPLRRFFVRHLRNAKAKEVAGILDSLAKKGVFSFDDRPLYERRMIPPMAVEYDERTNSVLVNASVYTEERIRSIVDELDRPLAPATQPQQEIRIENGVLQSRP